LPEKAKLFDEQMLKPEEKYLRALYEAFNRRETEAVLAMMDEHVVWANGMEGGFVHGRDNVREYWRRQFETLSPALEPLNFATDARNRQVVTVRQIVRDLAGNLLLEKTVRQIFTIENERIILFEIEEGD
jgi:limonene-1,2-epoxide hydrolase